MIKGIGVDICQISRIKLNLANRILNDKELVLYEGFKDEKRKKEFLAGRFSAKEAILKALTGIKEKIYMKDITILNDKLGKPYVMEPIFLELKIHVSISHEKEYSVAQAIIESV